MSVRLIADTKEKLDNMLRVTEGLMVVIAPVIAHTALSTARWSTVRAAPCTGNRLHGRLCSLSAFYFTVPWSRDALGQVMWFKVDPDWEA